MNELEKNINQIKAGNYLKYTGPLYQYRDQIGRVTSVEEMNGRESYSLQMFDHNKNPIAQEIRAYQEGVRDIPLKEEHLLSVGFVKDPTTSVYYYRGITIFCFMARKINSEGEIIIELADYWATTK